MLFYLIMNSIGTKKISINILVVSKRVKHIWQVISQEGTSIHTEMKCLWYTLRMSYVGVNIYIYIYYEIDIDHHNLVKRCLLGHPSISCFIFMTLSRFVAQSDHKNTNILIKNIKLTTVLYFSSLPILIIKFLFFLVFFQNFHLFHFFFLFHFFVFYSTKHNTRVWDIIKTIISIC